jgi:hypothetical protein
MRVLHGRTEWHSHERAHRPGHAHAEVVGAVVLANTLVPREWAALLREVAANAHARVGVGSSRAENRRRHVQESAKDAQPLCEERRRPSAFEPIS